ncbi:recombinase family protein [Mucilaginibacter sp.]|uniref:recombinase family protein n=1 Tax=Mucilaginibacter sp. TaxID=1882438 RepID=UPI0025F6EF8D|nr:recombinase family protein [Mucilaginibacter sp.]
MEKQKIVGSWIRVSTDFQVDNDSPEHHMLRAQMYADAKGWHLIEVYRLDAISGKSIMDQPETKRMLADIRSGRITGLIFSKLARLARNTKELLDFAEIFRESNADLISLAESIDTSTPAGRLFYTVIAAMAQWEREEISSRVAASVPIRARMNKPLGGQAPFGYAWVDKEMVIDENEAPIRKLMHELFIEHKRKGTVADVLNKQGYRTRNGSKFTDTTIGRLLIDPMAKGERRANYTKSLGENKQWVYKPQEEWIVMPCPRIVSDEVWNECNRILDVQAKPRKKPAKKPVHLFTNLLFCSCGPTKMYIPSNSKKYVCTACRKSRIEENDLEEIYFAHLKSFLLTKEHLATYLSKADATIEDKSEQLKTLNQELKKVREHMDKLLDLHLSGELPKQGFGDKYNPLNERAQQLTEQLPRLEAEIDFLKMQTLNSSHLHGEAQNLYDRWPQLSIEAKRTIAEQITDSITIGGDEIHIKFSYNPSLLGIEPDSQRNLRGSYSPPA